MVPKMFLLNGAVVDLSTPVISISFLSLYSQKHKQHSFTGASSVKRTIKSCNRRLGCTQQKLLTALGTSDTSTWKFPWDYQFICCTK